MSEEININKANASAASKAFAALAIVFENDQFVVIINQPAYYLYLTGCNLSHH